MSTPPPPRPDPPSPRPDPPSRVAPASRPVTATSGLAGVGKALLITVGVLAVLALLGSCAMAAILGSAMHGIQNMNPSSFPTYATYPGASNLPSEAPSDAMTPSPAATPSGTGSPTGAGAATQPALSARARALLAWADPVCDANARLNADLLQQGRLLRAGADPFVREAYAATVSAHALLLVARAWPEGAAPTPPAGSAAAFHALRNDARSLAGLADAAAALTGRDDPAAALASTQEAWAASLVLDRDLRRVLIAAGAAPGVTTIRDACAAPLDPTAWNRIIAEPTTP